MATPFIDGKWADMQERAKEVADVICDQIVDSEASNRLVGQLLHFAGSADDLMHLTNSAVRLGADLSGLAPSEPYEPPEKVAPRWRDVTRSEDGVYHCKEWGHYLKSFDLGLAIVYELWDVDGIGEELDGLADGYGEGNGTHGDWSGIRDSSEEAKAAMVQACLNHLFPKGLS